VAWKGTDADGDPLTARVETSKDGGATWRTVSVGITASQMSLERNLFARSQRARVRVTVSDGWNETAATSKVFRSLGAPPAVVIRTPVPGATVAADGLVSLSGQGSDDSLKPLPGGSLRWFDGKRPLGRGATLDVRGLRAGVRTLRLRGRDAAGRLGSDTVRVKVKAVTPQLLSLKGPKKLGRKATKVRLRVAASVPATLKVRRQRFAVSREPKVIRVKVKPGKGRLGLTLVLRAGKKSARSVLFIPR
jgi:hypothetical protein